MPISVVIPCYNTGGYLAAALASVARQTRTVREIIIVDDGSTDPQTRSLLGQLAGQGHRVITLPENRGLAAARNAGIGYARGEFIFPFDTDDELHPKCLERLLLALQSHPEKAIAYPQIVILGDIPRVEVKRRRYDFYHLLFEDYICGNSLFRRSLWQQIGGYDETMRQGYEDWEFWIRAGKAGGWGVFVGAAVFYYRHRSDSLSHISRTNRAALRTYIQHKHADVYNQAALAALKARWQPEKDYELFFAIPRIRTANWRYELRRACADAGKAMFPGWFKRAVHRRIIMRHMDTW